MRHGWHIHFDPLQNDYGTQIEGDIIFERPDPERRTPPNEMKALREGFDPSFPIHTRINLMEPAAIEAAVKRIQRSFG